MTIKLQGKDIRQAFEVEKIIEGVRRNYVFEWQDEKNRIVIWDTSRDVGRKYLDMDTSETAFDRFKQIYKESITTYSFADGIFLGWVNPVTQEPLED